MPTSVRPIDGPRARLAQWLESTGVQRAVTILIVVNAIVFGLETFPAVVDVAGRAIQVLDEAILAIFVVEIGLRIAAHGWRFFRDPWSVFDFVVTAIALVPATGSLSALRALRVLRVLRLVSTLPQLRAVVTGLLRAIPGLSSIAGLLCLVLYVAAIIATNLYREASPELFGTLAASLLTLFQIMTLEGWADILRDIMRDHPWAPLFFIPFVLVTTFTFLNLFIAVIVEGMQAAKSHEHAAEEAAGATLAAELRADVARLQATIDAMRRDLENGRIAAEKPHGASD